MDHIFLGLNEIEQHVIEKRSKLRIERIQQVRNQEREISKSRCQLFRHYVDERKREKIEKSTAIKMTTSSIIKKKMETEWKLSLIDTGEAHRMASEMVVKMNQNLLNNENRQHQGQHTAYKRHLAALKKHKQEEMEARRPMDEVNRLKQTKYEMRRSEREDAKAAGEMMMTRQRLQESKEINKRPLIVKNKIFQSAESIKDRSTVSIHARIVRHTGAALDNTVNNALVEEERCVRSNHQKVMKELLHRNSIISRAKVARKRISVNKCVNSLESQLQSLEKLDLVGSRSQRLVSSEMIRNMHNSHEEQKETAATKGFEDIFFQAVPIPTPASERYRSEPVSDGTTSVAINQTSKAIRVDYPQWKSSNAIPFSDMVKSREEKPSRFYRPNQQSQNILTHHDVAIEQSEIAPIEKDELKPQKVSIHDDNKVKSQQKAFEWTSVVEQVDAIRSNVPRKSPMLHSKEKGFAWKTNNYQGLGGVATNDHPFTSTAMYPTTSILAQPITVKKEKPTANGAEVPTSSNQSDGERRRMSLRSEDDESSLQSSSQAKLSNDSSESTVQRGRSGLDQSTLFTSYQKFKMEGSSQQILQQPMQRTLQLTIGKVQSDHSNSMEKSRIEKDEVNLTIREEEVMSRSIPSNRDNGTESEPVDAVDGVDEVDQVVADESFSSLGYIEEKVHEGEIQTGTMVRGTVSHDKRDGSTGKSTKTVNSTSTVESDSTSKLFKDWEDLYQSSLNLVHRRNNQIHNPSIVEETEISLHSKKSSISRSSDAEESPVSERINPFRWTPTESERSISSHQSESSNRNRNHLVSTKASDVVTNDYRGRASIELNQITRTLDQKDSAMSTNYKSVEEKAYERMNHKPATQLEEENIEPNFTWQWMRSTNEAAVHSAKGIHEIESRAMSTRTSLSTLSSEPFLDKHLGRNTIKNETTVRGTHGDERSSPLLNNVDVRIVEANSHTANGDDYRFRSYTSRLNERIQKLKQISNSSLPSSKQHVNNHQYPMANHLPDDDDDDDDDDDEEEGDDVDQLLEHTYNHPPQSFNRDKPVDIQIRPPLSSYVNLSLSEHNMDELEDSNFSDSYSNDGKVISSSPSISIQNDFDQQFITVDIEVDRTSSYPLVESFQNTRTNNISASYLTGDITIMPIDSIHSENDFTALDISHYRTLPYSSY